jgi:hypothetical protein
MASQSLRIGRRGEVRKLRRRAAELVEEEEALRRAVPVLADRERELEEELELAVFREGEERHYQALENLRTKGVSLIEWLVGQVDGELGRLCGELEAAFETAVGAESFS